MKRNLLYRFWGIIFENVDQFRTRVKVLLLLKSFNFAKVVLINKYECTTDQELMSYAAGRGTALAGHDPGSRCCCCCCILKLWRHINQTVNDGVAHSKNPRKCAYNVTFDLDLDLDLEHTLDARWPGVHRVQVWWRSGRLPARRSDLRKSLQTDRQTDGQTTDASPYY